MRAFFLRIMIGCLALGLCTIGLFSQPFPEYSLDDYPNNVSVMPFGPWSGGNVFPPPAPMRFGSAECEWNQPNIANLAGFIGPSPTLLPVFPQPGPFNDSDVLVAGPALLTTFPPPPIYMDAVSTNNWEMSICDTIYIEFSVDRATGGIPGNASFNQAALNEQPGDIYRVDQPGFAHVNLFLPLPFPAAVPPPGPPIFPWTNYCGGMINPANGFTSPPYVRPGPAGMGGGGNNWLLYDHAGYFNLLPQPAPYPMIAPGTHDNIDAYNRWLYSLLDVNNTDIYFCLHPASAYLQGPGLSAADIFNCTQPGGVFWPAPIFAQSWQIGLDISSGVYKPNEDSIDGLSVFDNGIKGVMEAKIDFVGFTLAPGSATLIALNNLGYPANAATIFVSDFQINPATGFGFFYVYLVDTDIGVGNMPAPPLPGVLPIDINVDALELTIDPAPIPYTNPITKPIIDPVTKK